MSGILSAHQLDYDLRKLKDPCLKLQIKSDISKIVHDAVLQQLQQDVLPLATSSTFISWGSQQCQSAFTVLH